MEKKQIAVTEREKRVIKWIANLSDRELFGLECFLAGTRVAAQKDMAPEQQSMDIKNFCLDRNDRKDERFEEG